MYKRHKRNKEFYMCQNKHGIVIGQIWKNDKKMDKRNRKLLKIKKKNCLLCREKSINAGKNAQVYLEKNKLITFFYVEITFIHVALCHISVEYSQGTVNEFQVTYIF